MKKAIKELKRLKARRIFVQYPEGLKLRIQEIAKQLEKAGFEIVVCLQECFGACDIRDEEAKRLGCDAVLHIGHEEFVKKTVLPVVYWEYFMDVDSLPVIEKELEKLKEFRNIGLVTSIQFVNEISKVKEFLEKRGKKAFAHKSLQFPGQVLGCNLEAAKAIEDEVDCFLCISAGKFYALGIMFMTEKPVLCLDLEKKEIYSLQEEKKKIHKIMIWNRAQLKDAKKIGLLVSWKKGQMLHEPYKIKAKLENEGKEVFIFAMDEILPERIMGLKLDLLINCACPRIGLDDLQRYRIPILNIQDV